VNTDGFFGQAEPPGLGALKLRADVLQAGCTIDDDRGEGPLHGLAMAEDIASILPGPLGNHRRPDLVLEVLSQRVAEHSMPQELGNRSLLTITIRRPFG
jgi:hypothetical protein